MNKDVENEEGDMVGDLVVYDDLEKNDASTTVEQEYQGDIGASDYAELDQVHVVNNAHSHANIDSDEQINVGNQANNVQAKSICSDSSEMKDPSTPSEQELPVQHVLDSVEVNIIDQATDANSDPSKDSDHTIDAVNMNVDEPDCTLHSVEVNTVDKANDANGHPSQDSDDRIDAENSNVDEPDIIHDSSKTNDANTAQTQSMVDDDVEQNDVSTNNNQGLQKETVSDDVEIEKADKTTDAFGHVNTDCDDRIDEENTIDQGRDLSIQDGAEMNDASIIIEHEIQEENVSPIQTNTPMQGGSLNIGEQNIVQGGLILMNKLLTSGFNNNEDQASHEEVKDEDYGIGGSSDSSVKLNHEEVKHDSSDSSVKLSVKHNKEKSKNKVTIPFDKDSDDKSEGYKSLQKNNKMNLN